MVANTVLSIVHHGPSDAGRVADLLAERGMAIEHRSPLNGDDLPDDFSAYAGIAIFGGTMGANDDHLPGIRRELDWIPKAAGSGLPVLGCCLGGQLIARALGGRVYRQPQGRWEVGYTAIEATAAGAQVFPEPRPHFYSWHQDGFDLPAGAELLAAGDETFPNQAFRYGTTVYAVQFHPEADSALFTQWMQWSPEFETLPGAHSRQRQLDDAGRFEARADTWLSGFLSFWLAEGRVKARTGTG